MGEHCGLMMGMLNNFIRETVGLFRSQGQTILEIDFQHLVAILLVYKCWDVMLDWIGVDNTALMQIGLYWPKSVFAAVI